MGLAHSTRRILMPRVIHFEIPAQDPQRVARFYQDVFGWTIEKWQGPVEYWLVMTGPDGTPGINGGLYKPRAPFSGTVNTLDVDDLDASLAKVKAHGGTVVMDKMAVPSMGWLAYCADVEGTIFGLMQADPHAA
jgi:predicted enzyme related to lactoylglutathione lyase